MSVRETLVDLISDVDNSEIAFGELLRAVRSWKAAKSHNKTKREKDLRAVFSKVFEDYGYLLEDLDERLKERESNEDFDDEDDDDLE